jgi:hypothetical protein
LLRGVEDPAAVDKAVARRAGTGGGDEAAPVKDGGAGVEVDVLGRISTSV